MTSLFPFTLRFLFVAYHTSVMKDELETAMRNIGITTLDEAGPHLVHTADIDHLVPESRQHPYARKVAKGRRSLHLSKL